MNGKSKISLKKWSLGTFITLILIVGIPFFINMLYIYGHSHTSMLTIWNKTEILGFYGTVLGSGATIFAVVKTINHNSKSIEMQFYYDASKINIPFFVIENITCSVCFLKNDIETYAQKATLNYSRNTWDVNFKINDEDYDASTYRLVISLKNIGDGLAIYTSDECDDCRTRDNAETIAKDQLYEAVFTGEINPKDIQKIQISELWECPKNSIEHPFFYSNIRGVRLSQKVYGDFCCSIPNNTLSLEVYHLTPQEILHD